MVYKLKLSHTSRDIFGFDQMTKILLFQMRVTNPFVNSRV